MTREELKNSGKLDLYIMGALPEHEAQEVEALLLEYPELLLEVNGEQDALAAYAEQFSKQPAPALKARVMDALSQLDNSAVRQEFQMKVASKSGGMIYQIAAGILLLVSIGLSWMLMKKNATIDSLSEKLAANEVQLAEGNSRFSSLRATLNTVTGAGVQQVRLRSTDTSKVVYATIFYDRVNQQILVQQGNLAERTDDMQYQVWALIDGKPYSAGVFDAGPDTDSLKIIHTELKAQLFAVSIEKRGGAEVPTPERIILISDKI